MFKLLILNVYTSICLCNEIINLKITLDHLLSIFNIFVKGKTYTRFTLESHFAKMPQMLSFF